MPETSASPRHVPQLLESQRAPPGRLRQQGGRLAEEYHGAFHLLVVSRQPVAHPESQPRAPVRACRRHP
eukprot:2761045-Lingulodinium_polyedra.AAC.1